MLNIKELEEMGKKAGFSYVALLKSDSIQLMPEVREMCKNNTCHMYAKRWSCPPGCGDLEVCRKKDRKVQGRHYCPDSGETGGSFGRRDDDGDRSGSLNRIFMNLKKCSEKDGRACSP